MIPKRSPVRLEVEIVPRKQAPPYSDGRRRQRGDSQQIRAALTTLRPGKVAAFHAPDKDKADSVHSSVYRMRRELKMVDDVRIWMVETTVYAERLHRKDQHEYT